MSTEWFPGFCKLLPLCADVCFIFKHFKCEELTPTMFFFSLLSELIVC